MKNKNIDKFREELNDDIDKIIEEDESEKEGTFFKPSHLFLTISIVCLVFVFGYLKGLCIFGFVVICIWFFTDEIEILKKSKKKENTDKILTGDDLKKLLNDEQKEKLDDTFILIYGCLIIICTLFYCVGFLALVLLN